MANLLMRLILNHYGPTTYTRSEEQIIAERTLFRCVQFNRWFLIPAALIIQFACGSLYAWSVYNTYLDSIMYGNPKAGISPNIFYVAVGCFGLSAAFTGPWLERNGPRKGAFVGASLYFLGNLVAALGVALKIHAIVFLGYGIIGGSGLGLSYISPVSSLQKWFPDRRGLASGFAVCAFGGGSIAIALVIRPLNDSIGVAWTFALLGLCYFVPVGGATISRMLTLPTLPKSLLQMVFAALILRAPPPNFQVNGLTSDRVQVNSDVEKTATESKLGQPAHQPPTLKLTLIESLTSREYALMYMVFFANSIAGLLVISRLSNMITEIYGANLGSLASYVVSINGGVNLFGRLFFSFLSDIVGRKTVFIITLSVQVVALAFIPVLFRSPDSLWFFVACMFCITACYGAGFGVMPAFLADQFGSCNIGACHGCILTSWALAGVGGGLLFTGIFNYLAASAPVKYSTNFYWILSIVCLGFIVVMFIRTDPRDKLLPPVPGQQLRMRMFGRQVRLVNGRVEVVSKEKEEQEWEAFLDCHYNRSQYVLAKDDNGK